MKPLVSKEQFQQMDIRVGKVVKAERKEGADKLIRLTVDFGTEEGTRNILTSLYPMYEPESFEGKNFIFLLNLEPRKFLGEESQGMILCSTDGENIARLTTLEDSAPGDSIT
ncbi:MAG TPA: methionine--tRNA ligase subunit beta [Patescibacteria group bacterium]|nr:methionine--tRNA ligase subunit beta [Patescibacteria group bacterium]